MFLAENLLAPGLTRGFGQIWGAKVKAQILMTGGTAAVRALCWEPHTGRGSTAAAQKNTIAELICVCND